MTDAPGPWAFGEPKAGEPPLPAGGSTGSASAEGAGGPEGGCAPQIPLTSREQKIFHLLLAVLEKNGQKDTVLRVAGGWVRDKLRGVWSDDIDIAISDLTGLALAEMVNAELQARGEEAHSVGLIRKNPERSKHLETACVRIQGVDIDLVNLRKETYSEDSRVPDSVAFGSPEEDASRRDFCVNALFYNLSTGEIEDFTGRGLQDLRDRVIRTPLDCRETFRDDPLRALRAVRFCCKLGFRLDPEIGEAMRNEELANRILIVSRQRYNKELVEMFRWDAPRAVAMLWDLNLYRPVFFAPYSEASGKSVFPTAEEELAHKENASRLLSTAWERLQRILSLVHTDSASLADRVESEVPRKSQGFLGLQGSLAAIPADPKATRDAHDSWPITKRAADLPEPGEAPQSPDEPVGECFGTPGPQASFPDPRVLALARDMLVPGPDPSPLSSPDNETQIALVLSLTAIALCLPERQYEVPAGLLDPVSVRGGKKVTASAAKYVTRYCCAQSNATASRVEEVLSLVSKLRGSARTEAASSAERLGLAVHQSADPLVLLVACCFCPWYQGILSHYGIWGGGEYLDFIRAKPALDLAAEALALGVADRRRYAVVKDALLLCLLGSPAYATLVRDPEATRAWLAREESQRFLRDELTRMLGPGPWDAAPAGPAREGGSK